MNFEIPCATIARMSNILDETDDIWMNGIRIDNGRAVATNSKLMIIENIGGNEGVMTLRADPVLIEQCKTEAPFDSKLFITVNDILKFASAKTSLGYNYTGNAAIWSDLPNKVDGWHDIIPKEPAKATTGAMAWSADLIARLAEASPSRCIVFEYHIDIQKPTLVQDIFNDDWLGVFLPVFSDAKYKAAMLPNWLVLK